MSARAAVFKLLTEDSVLSSVYGINSQSVWPAQALDTAPRDRRFLILRWEEMTMAYKGAGTEILTVWAHCPREMSTDFAPLSAILKRATDVLTSATHIVGDDGVLTCVDFNGTSADFNDEGYKTITKNAAYTVVSR